MGRGQHSKPGFIIVDELSGGTAKVTDNRLDVNSYISGGTVAIDGGTVSIDGGTVDIHPRLVHTIGGQDTLATSIFHDVEVTQDTAADLNCTEVNSGAIKTAVELIDNCVSGTEMQVDIVTMPDVDINDISKGTQTNDIKVTLDSEQIVKTGDLIQVDHDYIALGYTGSNLTTITYKTGGSGGSTVATLTLAYTGAQLDSVTKT